MNKVVRMDLQHAFKKKNNKPGSQQIHPNEVGLIKSAKQLLKTTD